MKALKFSLMLLTVMAIVLPAVAQTEKSFCGDLLAKATSLYKKPTLTHEQLEAMIKRSGLTKGEAAELIWTYVETGAVGGDIHQFAFAQNARASLRYPTDGGITDYKQDGFTDVLRGRYSKRDIRKVVQQVANNTEQENKTLAKQMASATRWFLITSDHEGVAATFPSEVQENLKKLRSALERTEASLLLEEIYAVTLPQIANITYRRGNSWMADLLGYGLTLIPTLPAFASYSMSALSVYFFTNHPGVDNAIAVVGFLIGGIAVNLVNESYEYDIYRTCNAVARAAVGDICPIRSESLRKTVLDYRQQLGQP